MVEVKTGEVPIPEVSVLVATSGRSDPLRGFLQTLSHEISNSPRSVDVWILENGKKSSAEAIIDEFLDLQLDINYQYFDRPGKAAALNWGASMTNADVLLFADDDVQVPEGWLETMLKPFDEAGVSAVMGGVKIADHLMRPWFTVEHRRMLAEVSEELYGHSPHLVGANMALRRSAFFGVGGFDEALGPGASGLGEDSLLGDLLLKRGYRIVTRFDKPVIHFFDENRLRRNGWLSHASKNGLSQAYSACRWHGRFYYFPLTRWLLASARYLIETIRLKVSKVGEETPFSLYERKRVQAFYRGVLRFQSFRRRVRRC